MVLLGHVAKAEGSEYSGSTAWDAAVRSRLLLAHEGQGDEKQLFLRKPKANYSETDALELEWRDGMLHAVNQFDDMPAGKLGGWCQAGWLNPSSPPDFHIETWILGPTVDRAGFNNDVLTWMLEDLNPEARAYFEEMCAKTPDGIASLLSAMVIPLDFQEELKALALNQPTQIIVREDWEGVGAGSRARIVDRDWLRCVATPRLSVTAAARSGCSWHGRPPARGSFPRLGMAPAARPAAGRATHRRTASVARITGMRSCTRMIALASVTISV